MKTRKNMDEMDRNIVIRSESIGYRASLFVLSIWTIVLSFRSLRGGEDFSILPVLMLCFVLSVQNFSRVFIKQSMLAGDYEYKENNKFFQAIFILLIVSALILFAGSYFGLRA